MIALAKRYAAARQRTELPATRAAPRDTDWEELFTAERALVELASALAEQDGPNSCV